MNWSSPSSAAELWDDEISVLAPSTFRHQISTVLKGTGFSGLARMKIIQAHASSILTVSLHADWECFCSLWSGRLLPRFRIRNIPLCFKHGQTTDPLSHQDSDGEIRGT